MKTSSGEGGSVQRGIVHGAWSELSNYVDRLLIRKLVCG